MIDVYCFSGAGHSAEVAAYCAERLGGRVIPIGADTVCRDERALIVFPVYCENLPPPVVGFLRRAEAGCAAFIATYGGMSYGHVLYDAQQLFPGSVAAGAYVPTEHSLAREGYRFDGAPLAPVLAKLSEGGTEIMLPKTQKHILSDFAPAWRSRIGARLVRGGNCVGCNACGATCPMGANAAGTGQQRLHPLLKMRARLSKTRAMCASFARSQPLSSPPQMQRYDRVLLAKIAADAVKGRLEGAITQKMRKSCVKFLKHGHSCDTIII